MAYVQRGMAVDVTLSSFFGDTSSEMTSSAAAAAHRKDGATRIGKSKKAPLDIVKVEEIQHTSFENTKNLERFTNLRVILAQGPC